MEKSLKIVRAQYVRMDMCQYNPAIGNLIFI